MSRTADGDVDFAKPAELIGHPARSAMLRALLDGRALPMSMLASEAGVAASTASAHLTRMVDGGLLTIRQQGRHRYYELASRRVADAVEALAAIGPQVPVRSLRAGTRAAALRRARTCYDHLAGHLGIAVMSALLERDALVGGDGRHDPERDHSDRLASTGRHVTYDLTDAGWALLEQLEVTLPRSRRQTVAYCVDWTEQRHHVSGALGAGLCTRFEELEWIRRGAGRVARAVEITDAGRDGLRRSFDIDTEELAGLTA